MDCKECKNYFRNHNDKSHCGGNFENLECEDFEQIPYKEIMKVRPDSLCVSPNITVGMSSVLWRSENKFALFMFKQLYSKTNNDDGKPYTEVYQHEIKELMDNMYIGLSIILKIFDEYTIDDVIKIFTINFWETKRIIDCDFETLTEIAYKYDELYGDSIGDKPTFG